jgi:HTH-type transcriptional regulator, competence development regulator
MPKEKTFGETIKELRKAKNLSQRDLAAKVGQRLKDEDRRGFDFTYLSKIENDRMSPPSAAAIIQLARELDANSDDLLALAGKIPQDLGETLKKSEGARAFYRSVKTMNLSDEDWQKLLQDLKRRKDKK